MSKEKIGGKYRLPPMSFLIYNTTKKNENELVKLSKLPIVY